MNNTNKSRDFVELAATLEAERGIKIDFVNNQKLKESGFAVDGAVINGVKTSDGLKVNIQAAKSLNRVVGHEITHILKGTEAYKSLKTTILEYAKSKGDYQARYDSVSRLYKNVKNANIEEEITADLVGDYLFTDEDFIKRLSTNKTLFQKVFDEIKYLFKIATSGSKEKAQLEKVKKAFEKAFADTSVKSETKIKNTTNKGDVKYSLSDTGIELRKHFDKYPYNVQTVIKEYVSAVNEDVLEFAEKYIENPNADFDRQKISDVSQRQAKDISRLLNIDVSEYSNSINKNAIIHITKRHGLNGIADDSMSNPLDIARLGYVLENYDDISIAKDGEDDVYSSEFMDSRDNPSPMLVYKKKINGTYYLVQAIPESKYKKLWIVSAYINKKGQVTQALTDKSGMSPVSPQPENSIPENAEKSNPFDEKSSKNSSNLGEEDIAPISYDLSNKDISYDDDIAPIDTKTQDKKAFADMSTKAKERAQYSLSEDAQTKITADMTEEERYEALKKRSINNIPLTTELPSSVLEKIPEISSWEDINNYLGSKKRNIIHTLAKEFGTINKEFYNDDIKLSFEFSNNNFNETYKKQQHNFEAFAKMFSVFDDIISSAIGVEVHNNSNHRYDATLDNVYVLMSAYQDGNDLVPVKLEVKKFKDKQNTLYVAVSLEKIKITEVLGRGNTNNGVTQQPRSVNISIANIFKKINTLDKSFLKYIPDGFLNAEQLKTKKIAIKEANDSDYKSAVNRGDMETAQKMVDEAAKKAGYTIKSYHGTLAKDFTEFKKSFIGSRFNFDDKGFFFIDRKSIAEDYSSSEFDSSKKGRVLDVYLRVKKPLRVDKQFCLREGLGNPFRDDDTIGVWDAYSEFFKEEAEKRRADGIILDDGMSKMTVVFEGEQIKSAETITYDDEGNIIPLSERFNSANRDIRYSLSDDDIAPIGNNDVLGKDISYDEDIAPIDTKIQLEAEIKSQEAKIKHLKDEQHKLENQLENGDISIKEFKLIE